MRIEKIDLENILSFNKTTLELKRINFIVGPNNVGKTNVARILRDIHRSISWDFSSFNSYITRVINSIIRFGSKNKSFKVVISFNLNKNEMKKIRAYFEMFGDVASENIYNTFSFSKASERSNLDLKEMTKRFDHISKRLKRKNNQNHRRDLLKDNISKLFTEVWQNAMDEVITLLIPNETVQIIWELEEGHRNSPKIHVGLNRYILDQNDSLGITRSTGSYTNISMNNLFSELQTEIISYLENSLNNKPTEEYKEIIKKTIVKAFTNLKEGERIKLDIDFDHASNIKEKIKLKSNRIFPGYIIEEDRRINLYSILSDWLAGNLFVMENTRGHSTYNSFGDYLKERVTSTYLPSILFQLKNSPNLQERNNYEQIRNKFNEITGYHFDVVSNIYYEQYSETSDIVKEKYPHVNLRDGLRLNIQQGTLEGMEGNIHLVFLSGTNSNIQFYTEFAGSGLYELLYLLTVIIGIESSILFLDEPAVNIHPSWQREILKVIVEKVQNREKQIILTTHSPYFIPDFTLDEPNMKFYYFFLEKSNNETKPIEIDHNTCAIG